MSNLKPCQCNSAAGEICGPCARGENTRPNPAPVGEQAVGDAFGWLYFNPDTGVEWSADHPVESGQVDDAEQVQPATATAMHPYLIEAWDQLAAARADLDAERDAKLRLMGQIADMMGEAQNRDAEIERLKGIRKTVICKKITAVDALFDANTLIAQLTEALREIKRQDRTTGSEVHVLGPCGSIAEKALVAAERHGKEGG